MHVSVLLREAVEALAVVPGGSYIDGTLGGAGHAAEILRRAGPTGRLLGIDRDTEALARSAVRLRAVGGEKTLIHGTHGEITRLAEENGFAAVDGILLDLGVSSEQLDTPGRGFSFRLEGPLDMRMDPTRGESAADLIARVDVPSLADVLRRLGEEPQARRIAQAIGRAREKRPIDTTGRLAEVVSEALGGRKGPRHPATRVFQALRMAVNRELEDLEQALEGGQVGVVKVCRSAVVQREVASVALVHIRGAAGARHRYKPRPQPRHASLFLLRDRVLPLLLLQDGQFHVLVAGLPRLGGGQGHGHLLAAAVGVEDT